MFAEVKQMISINIVHGLLIKTILPLLITLTFCQYLSDGFALVLHHTAVLVLLQLIRRNSEGAGLLKGPVLIGKKFTKIHILVMILSIFLPGDCYFFGVKTCSMTHDWRRGRLLPQRHLRRDWERDKMIKKDIE